jgi:hypothetical protein
MCAVHTTTVNPLPSVAIVNARLASATEGRGTKETGKAFGTKKVPYESKGRHQRTANQESEHEFFHVSSSSGFLIAFPFFLNQLSHPHCRVREPVRFLATQIFLNVGYLPLRAKMDIRHLRSHRIKKHSFVAMLR